MDVIQIKNFTKIYKRKTIAVDGLSLNVQNNRFFGFVGPNGAGKTTTVQYLAGLIQPTKGELYLFDEKIKLDSYEYKRRVGFVLEKPMYIEKLTGEEYLHFAGQMFDIDLDIVKSRTRELFEFLELLPKKNQLIETYSNGMKKKISLAAALIHDPELLVLDEPMEGIDAVSAKAIRTLLQSLPQKGKTIFFTSHRLELVEQLCEEIAIIHKGKLIYQGSMDTVRAELTASGDQNITLENFFLKLVEGDKPKSLSWLQ